MIFACVLFTGCVRDYVDAAHEARRNQLLTTEPAPLYGALREVVVSDGHARLAQVGRKIIARSGIIWRRSLRHLSTAQHGSAHLLQPLVKTSAGVHPADAE